VESQRLRGGGEEERGAQCILKCSPAAYQPIAASLGAGPGEPDSALTIRLSKGKSSVNMWWLCLPPGLKVEAGSLKEEELDNRRLWPLFYFLRLWTTSSPAYSHYSRNHKRCLTKGFFSDIRSTAFRFGCICRLLLSEVNIPTFMGNEVIFFAWGDSPINCIC